MKFFDEKFREMWIEETADCGMKVVIIHKPLFETTACVLAVPYGSLDIRQIDQNGHVYEYLPGTAHFLEHKLFESDHGDALQEFSHLGTNVNAYTSYDETVYYFTTPSTGIEKSIDLLLKTVMSLSITEESVEREKSIILMERAMYEQEPSDRILLETFRMMYAEHPIREDIVGNFESIQVFTKEKLEYAYRLNYCPERMSLIISTPVDPETVLHMINSILNSCKIEKNNRLYLKRCLYEEKEALKGQTKVIRMDISQTRCSTGIRLNMKPVSPQERLKREWAIRLCFDSLYSPENPKYQNWLDEGKITSGFSYDLELAADRNMLIFMDNTDQCRFFAKFVQSTLMNLEHDLDFSIIERLKKRSIGTLLQIFDSPLDTAVTWYRGIQNGVNLFEEYSLLQTITESYCLSVLKEIDFSEYISVNLQKIE